MTSNIDNRGNSDRDIEKMAMFNIALCYVEEMNSDHAKCANEI